MGGKPPMASSMVGQVKIWLPLKDDSSIASHSGYKREEKKDEGIQKRESGENMFIIKKNWHFFSHILLIKILLDPNSLFIKVY